MKDFKWKILPEEDELDERKYNWAVIDTADKNRVQALTSDEKGARDSVKSSTISKHDYHYGKDPKTLKVVKLKKAHKDNDIGDPLKEEVELDEGKFKKGDIVIPNIGPHKGEKHTIIHDFKNGSYNISLNKIICRKYGIRSSP